MDENELHSINDENEYEHRSSALTYMGLVILSAVLLAISIIGIFALDAFLIDIGVLQILELEKNLFSLPSILVMAIIGVVAYIVFYIIGFGVLTIISRNIKILEFNFLAHRKWHNDNDLYFFEYFTAKEDVGFKASVNRSAYGSILILGLAILIIENFLTIPDLLDLFWDASYIVMFSILGLLPLIIIFLYISPLLTKEINLYFHDKHNRTVRNVGGWMDDSLKLFAAIDILLVAIIIIDTSTITPAWLIFILCLVLAVFSMYLTITAIFNRAYHTKLNKKFKSHLIIKYQIPIRKVELPHRSYNCIKCNNILDYINLDKCDKCGAKIKKCIVCGDILDNPDEIYKCPECGISSHKDEFISWISMRKTCPSCKKKLDVSKL